MKQNQQVVIIDYGMGNIGSIINMLKFLGYKSVVSNDETIIKNADKIILPGVGHFDHAIENIQKLHLLEVINETAIIKKKPFLGICLGMQIMCQSSEEGELSGLSLIDAHVKKFSFNLQSNLKVPHMGWNLISISKDSNLLDSLDNNSRFYFVHSYYVQCKNEGDILTKTNFGLDYVSSFEKDNLIGVQFHPEKSHRFGITLFKNFLEKY
ncbi:imidazole glycerol phosphate synthase subunit HisH [Cecembia rubra]|uniref:Imidazole glycerol phosphate synthase subunit HisH n=1 Tax=Cecembia rubra TaxID=1485585 RepID=A0A2P8EA31_9BACT|nr:imidazole glycerol phosphate synthase subunit HisH [Cecembia rubra]PSL06319.1 glutamine amidotransferase [Cecembia rubra]